MMRSYPTHALRRKFSESSTDYIIMENFVTALSAGVIVLALSGVTYIAYSHPKQYKTLFFPPLFGLAMILIFMTGAWNLGVSKAKSAALEEIRQERTVIVQDLSATNDLARDEASLALQEGSIDIDAAIEKGKKLEERILESNKITLQVTELGYRVEKAIESKKIPFWIVPTLFVSVIYLFALTYLYLSLQTGKDK